MKRLLFIMALLTALGTSAQTKTAYIDLYLRGGAKHLHTTLNFDQTTVNLGIKNLGEILNILAEQGWKIDNTFNVRRIGVPVTRHKFHIIMRKEYQDGENPFDGLTLTYNPHSSSTNAEIAAATQQEKVLLLKIVIPNYAFQNNHELKEFTIPETVISIGSSAFYNCMNLESITIPHKTSSIGKLAFGECYKLKHIYCKPLTPPDLESYAFLHLSRSAKIYVPTTSVELYKEAKGWKKYAKQITGYNFQCD